MRPMAAAAIGALISGVAFYAVGARAAQNNPFAEMPAYVQTVDGRFIEVPGAKSVGFMPGRVPSMAAAQYTGRVTSSAMRVMIWRVAACCAALRLPP